MCWGGVIMEVSTSCHISFAVLVGILQYVRINYNTLLFSEFWYQKGIARNFYSQEVETKTRLASIRGNNLKAVFKIHHKLYKKKKLKKKNPNWSFWNSSHSPQAWTGEIKKTLCACKAAKNLSDIYFNKLWLIMASEVSHMLHLLFNVLC